MTDAFLLNISVEIKTCNNNIQYRKDVWLNMCFYDFKGILVKFKLVSDLTVLSDTPSTGVVFTSSMYPTTLLSFDLLYSHVAPSQK